MTKYSDLAARALQEKLEETPDDVSLRVILGAFAALEEQMMETILGTLNEALDLDRAAISALLLHRQPCNQALTDHPTIQTTEEDVGALGLINGIVERLTGKRIAMVVDDDPQPPAVNEFITYDPAATRAAAPAQ